MDYKEFIQNKHTHIKSCGFDVEKCNLNQKAFEWQRDVVRWALKKGKCALFESCGLGKTIQSLMWAREVVNYTNKSVIILAPLAVVNQTVREATKFGEHAIAVREETNISIPDIYVTNYEIMEHFNMKQFSGVVLDESSILKDFTSKTRGLLIDTFKDTPFKLCCTATPSPNDYTEMGNHSEFLGIMSRTEMLSTFFVHDGGDTSKWRLKGHAKEAFFEWVANWACCMNSPSDLGYDGSLYELPELRLHECIVKSNNLYNEDGQSMLFSKVTQTLNERRDARRESISQRTDLAAEIANNSDEQCLIWCDLNAESEALQKKVNESVEIRGSDTPEYKVKGTLDFIDGNVKSLISKPSITGMGVNLQNCHKEIFVGLSDSFEAYYQAVRRCWRFGQNRPVDVYIIISDAEGAVKSNIERKQKEAEELTRQLVKYTKNILMTEIQSTKRISETYYAVEKMILPDWLKGISEQ